MPTDGLELLDALGAQLVDCVTHMNRLPPSNCTLSIEGVSPSGFESWIATEWRGLLRSTKTREHKEKPSISVSYVAENEGYESLRLRQIF